VFSESLSEQKSFESKFKFRQTVSGQNGSWQQVPDRVLKIGKHAWKSLSW